MTYILNQILARLFLFALLFTGAFLALFMPMMVSQILFGDLLDFAKEIVGDRNDKS